MKNIKSTKLILLILIALIVTNGATYIITKNKNQEKEADIFLNDNFPHKSFGEDILAEINDMEKQINKNLE